MSAETQNGAGVATLSLLERILDEGRMARRDASQEQKAYARNLVGEFVGALAPSMVSRRAARGRRAGGWGDAAAARGEKRGFIFPIHMNK